MRREMDGIQVRRGLKWLKELLQIRNFELSHVKLFTVALLQLCLLVPLRPCY